MRGAQFLFPSLLPSIRDNRPCRHLEGEVMRAIVHGDALGLLVGIAQDEGIRAVGILKSGVDDSFIRITGSADARGAGLDHRCQVGDDVIVRVAGYVGVVRVVHIHGAIAGGAGARASVRTLVAVQHQVPDDDTHAPVVHRAQGDVLHVAVERLAEVAAIVPLADGSLSEEQFHVGSFLMDIL